MNPGVILVVILYNAIRSLFRKKEITCRLEMTQNNDKRSYHMLFPKTWDLEKIKKKIADAALKPLEKNEYKIIGVTDDPPMVIQIYLKDDLVIHAFPPKLYTPVG